MFKIEKVYSIFIEDGVDEGGCLIASVRSKKELGLIKHKNHFGKVMDTRKCYMIFDSITGEPAPSEVDVYFEDELDLAMDELLRLENLYRFHNLPCKHYFNKGCSCNNSLDDLGECIYKNGIINRKVGLQCPHAWPPTEILSKEKCILAENYKRTLYEVYENYADGSKYHGYYVSSKDGKIGEAFRYKTMNMSGDVTIEDGEACRKAYQYLRQGFYTK